MKRKADRKGKVAREGSWAHVLKAEGIGVNRDDAHCGVSTKVRPAEQHFIGAPTGFNIGIYPVSTKPKQKSRCTRP